jgi:ribose transport system substrate-binding protein
MPSLWTKTTSRATSVLAFLGCAAVVSCSRSSSVTIAFIPQMTANDLWEPAHLGSIESASGTRYGIYWNGPSSENDIQAQIAFLNVAINRQNAGIIVAPLQQLALMTPVETAVRHGIPTVVIGSPLPLAPTGKLFYVLNDEVKEGRIAAKRIGEQLHGEGTVAILGLNPNIAGLYLRVNSFESALARDYPHIQIRYKRMGSSSEAQAEEETLEILKSDPDLGAILSLTETATIGALYVLENEPNAYNVKLVGCDQTYGLLYSLSQGKIDAIIAENTYEMGKRAVRIIISSRENMPTPNAVLVKPILVTRENMNAPELIDVLSHDARVKP